MSFFATLFDWNKSPQHFYAHNTYTKQDKIASFHLYPFKYVGRATKLHNRQIYYNICSKNHWTERVYVHNIIHPIERNTHTVKKCAYVCRLFMRRQQHTLNDDDEKNTAPPKWSEKKTIHTLFANVFLRKKTFFFACFHLKMLLLLLVCYPWFIAILYAYRRELRKFAQNIFFSYVVVVD